MRFIKKLIVHLIANALGLWWLTKIFPEIFVINGEGFIYWENLLITSIIFGLINTFIKPLMKLVSFPLMIGSLWLFTFIINALVLIIVTTLVSNYNITVEAFDWFVYAIKGAFIISLVHWAIIFLFDR